MERKIIGERTKSALSHKRAKKEKTGGEIPYGFDVDAKGRLLENKFEQKGIRLIQKLHNEGYSLRKICVELKNQRFRTKKGKSNWNPKTVSMILRRKR